MHSQDDCIFCKIVRGEAECHKIHEDEKTITFLDAFPIAEGHTLVVSKEHHPNIYEAPEDVMQAVAANAKRVAGAIKRELEPDGLGVYQLNGIAAGQTVFHYHVHIVPSEHGEPVDFATRLVPEGDDQATLAARLSKAVER